MGIEIDTWGVVLYNKCTSHRIEDGIQVESYAYLITVLIIMGDLKAEAGGEAGIAVIQLVIVPRGRDLPQAPVSTVLLSCGALPLAPSCIPLLPYCPRHDAFGTLHEGSIVHEQAAHPARRHIREGSSRVPMVFPSSPTSYL